MLDAGPALYWDSTYAIALALLEYHAELKPEDVGLNELGRIVMSLPNFRDDPLMANDRLLLDIQIAWYEELDNT